MFWGITSALASFIKLGQKKGLPRNMNFMCGNAAMALYTRVGDGSSWYARACKGRMFTQRLDVTLASQALRVEGTLSGSRSCFRDRRLLRKCPLALNHHTPLAYVDPWLYHWFHCSNGPRPYANRLQVETAPLGRAAWAHVLVTLSIYSYLENGQQVLLQSYSSFNTVVLLANKFKLACLWLQWERSWFVEVFCEEDLVPRR